MRTFIAFIALAAANLVPSAFAFGQGQAQSEIIVPEFSILGLSTTVSVPDRGYGPLGGFRGASETRGQFRPGFGRGLATSRTASDTAVRVWIHQFDELEPGRKCTTAEAIANRADPFANAMHRYAGPITEPKEGSAPRTVAANTAAAPESLTNAWDEKESHAADLLRRGRDAQARGKLTVARIYYQSASQLDPVPSAQLAQKALRSLDGQFGAR